MLAHHTQANRATSNEKVQQSKPSMHAASKKSGSKLSSSKHRRRKRRESRGQNVDGDEQRIKAIERIDLLAHQPALEGMRKRPKIDEQVVLKIGNDQEQEKGVAQSLQIGSRNQRRVLKIVSNETKKHSSPIKINRQANRAILPEKEALTQLGVEAGRLSKVSTVKLSKLSTGFKNLKRRESRAQVKVKDKENTKAAQSRDATKGNNRNDVGKEGKSLECRFDACLDESCGKKDLNDSIMAADEKSESTVKHQFISSRDNGDDSNRSMKKKAQTSNSKCHAGEDEKPKSTGKREQISSHGKGSDSLKTRAHVQKVEHALSSNVSNRRTEKEVSQSEVSNTTTKMGGQVPLGKMKECDPKHSSDTSNENMEITRTVSHKKADQGSKSSTATNKVKAEKENEPGHANISSKKKQVTLTQGDFLETATEEKITSNPLFLKSDGEHPGMVSVEIRKPGTIKETTIYSKGERWQSSDPKYEGFAFTLGYI